MKLVAFPDYTHSNLFYVNPEYVAFVSRIEVLGSVQGEPQTRISCVGGSFETPLPIREVVDKLQQEDLR